MDTIELEERMRTSRWHRLLRFSFTCLLLHLLTASSSDTTNDAPQFPCSISLSSRGVNSIASNNKRRDSKESNFRRRQLQSEQSLKLQGITMDVGGTNTWTFGSGEEWAGATAKQISDEALRKGSVVNGSVSVTVSVTLTQTPAVLCGSRNHHADNVIYV